MKIYGLTRTAQELSEMTPLERREDRAAAARTVFGKGVHLDPHGNPVVDKDGRVITDTPSIPLNRNHLVAALRVAEKDNPNFEQIMAAHTLIVEENEHAAAARRAGK